MHWMFGKNLSGAVLQLARHRYLVKFYGVLVGKWGVGIIRSVPMPPPAPSAPTPTPTPAEEEEPKA